MTDNPGRSYPSESGVPLRFRPDPEGGFQIEKDCFLFATTDGYLPFFR